MQEEIDIEALKAKYGIEESQSADSIEGLDFEIPEFDTQLQPEQTPQQPHVFSTIAPIAEKETAPHSLMSDDAVDVSLDNVTQQKPAAQCGSGGSCGGCKGCGAHELAENGTSFDLPDGISTEPTDDAGGQIGFESATPAPEPNIEQILVQINSIPSGLFVSDTSRSGNDTPTLQSPTTSDPVASVHASAGNTTGDQSATSWSQIASGPPNTSGQIEREHSKAPSSQPESSRQTSGTDAEGKVSPVLLAAVLKELRNDAMTRDLSKSDLRELAASISKLMLEEAKITGAHDIASTLSAVKELSKSLTASPDLAALTPREILLVAATALAAKAPGTDNSRVPGFNAHAPTDVSELSRATIPASQLSEWQLQQASIKIASEASLHREQLPSNSAINEVIATVKIDRSAALISPSEPRDAARALIAAQSSSAEVKEALRPISPLAKSTEQMSQAAVQANPSPARMLPKDHAHVAEQAVRAIEATLQNGGRFELSPKVVGELMTILRMDSQLAGLSKEALRELAIQTIKSMQTEPPLRVTNAQHVARLLNADANLKVLSPAESRALSALIAQAAADGKISPDGKINPATLKELLQVMKADPNLSFMSAKESSHIVELALKAMQADAARTDSLKAASPLDLAVAKEIQKLIPGARTLSADGKSLTLAPEGAKLLYRLAVNGEVPKSFREIMVAVRADPLTKSLSPREQRELASQIAKVLGIEVRAGRAALLKEPIAKDLVKLLQREFGVKAEAILGRAAVSQELQRILRQFSRAIALAEKGVVVMRGADGKPFTGPELRREIMRQLKLELQLRLKNGTSPATR